jgi:hypothetical protein
VRELAEDFRRRFCVRFGGIVSAFVVSEVSIPSINFDVSEPLVSAFADAFDARCIRRWRSFVGAILATASFAKVAPSVIRLHPIDVVDLRRHYASHY